MSRQLALFIGAPAKGARPPRGAKNEIRDAPIAINRTQELCDHPITDLVENNSPLRGPIRHCCAATRDWRAARVWGLFRVEMPMTTVDAKHKLSRKPSSHRAMQHRLERYVAMGPNCPNGHPWAKSAKFTYHGYRFCDACTREKADKRRNDPMTYTGACPHGHAYTRENTMITVQRLQSLPSLQRKAGCQAAFVETGRNGRNPKARQTRRNLIRDFWRRPPPSRKGDHFADSLARCMLGRHTGGYRTGCIAQAKRPSCNRQRAAAVSVVIRVDGATPN